MRHGSNENDNDNNNNDDDNNDNTNHFSDGKDLLLGIRLPVR